MDYKVCNKCGTEKELTKFQKSSTCKDGRRGTCGRCRRGANSVATALGNHSYYLRNKTKINKRVIAYRKQRCIDDPQYRLIARMRNYMTKSLNGIRKCRPFIEYLGCPMEEFKTRLNSQFKCGMNWDNYGEWHIDHILPLSKFDLSKEKERLVAFHYSNLQPLWAEENNRKSNRIT